MDATKIRINKKTLIKPKKKSSKSSDIHSKAGTIANQPKTKQKSVEFYHKKVYTFLKKLKKDFKRLSIIYNSCINQEQERERKNMEEIDHLKKIYYQMQVHRANIKRKRWCRFCESEATYLSTINSYSYCSQECEMKQNGLVCAIGEKIEI